MAEISKGKVYHHRIPGARFIMPDGKDISFAGGSINTANFSEKDRKAVEEELDKVADQPSSMIYTKNPVESLAEKQALAETRGAAVAAFDTVNKVPAGSRTVPMPMAPVQQPVLTGSEVDLMEAGELGKTDLQKKIEAAKEKVAGANAAPSTSK